MQVSQIKPGEEKNFDAYAVHILQTTSWGHFLQSLGRRVDLLMDTSNASKQSYLVSYNTVPIIKKTIAYLQKSAIPSPAIIAYIKENHPDVFYIKTEPHVLESVATHKELGEIGFHKSNWNIFVPNSILIDLTKTIDDIQKEFNQNTKRNIKKAEKRNIIIEERTDFDAIEIFLSLNDETTKRQGYYSHSDEYYKHMWKTMVDEHNACMLLAKDRDIYVGAIVLFYHNNVLYYPYGASKGGDINGAMSYIHFNAMKRAKNEIPSILSDNDLTQYDLWGTLSRKHEESENGKLHPLYGVHRFKRGFGGNLVEYVGSYDYVINIFYYKLFSFVSALRTTYYSKLKSIHKRHA